MNRNRAFRRRHLPGPVRRLRTPPGGSQLTLKEVIASPQRDLHARSPRPTRESGRARAPSTTTRFILLVPIRKSPNEGTQAPARTAADSRQPAERRRTRRLARSAVARPTPKQPSKPLLDLEDLRTNDRRGRHPPCTHRTSEPSSCPFDQPTRPEVRSFRRRAPHGHRRRAGRGWRAPSARR